MNFDILESILSVFLIALIVAVVFRRLQLSVILGYLIVGTVVGPHGLKLIPESQNIKELAEFGIVFMMFTVGLEFSIPKLFTLKYPVFFIGSLQVLLSIAITAIIGVEIGMTKISAIVVGSIVAMSSTAIVIKQLHDQLELHSSHGMNAIGILLFQDLAVIPVIILISGLASKNSESLMHIFLFALLKGILAIFLIFIIGKKLLRPLFRTISKTRAIELFTLTVLFVTLMSAWITDFFGLSFALGAFLSGMMLSETEFRHQIEVEIRPFRDILLGLFFITIGMLADISSWYSTWPWIALLLSAILVGKMLLISFLSRLCKYKPVTSLRTGLILAQGGEFGFAILTLALSLGVLSPEYGQVILAALLISIAISPILIYFNSKVSLLFTKKSSEISDASIQLKIKEIAHDMKKHIILCGFGRVGQHISRLLDKTNVPYIGLDMDSELVHRTSLAGYNVIFGDATHPSILKAAGIEQARVLAISLSDIRACKQILSVVKQLYPNLPIVVRCRDEKELKELKECGANYAIAELFEEGIALTHQLMQVIKMPINTISRVIQEARNKDYDLLNKIFTGSLEEHEDSEFILNRELRAILIPEDAKTIGMTLEDLNLKALNIEIIAIRRGKKQLKPQNEINLNKDDILIIFGEIPDLEEAERILLGS